MPLDASGLQSDLESLFSDPPAERSDCAQAWADAMESYASAIVPVSTTVSAAASTLASDLDAAFALDAAAAAMETAFTAFATTVGGGMAPAYTATPPPGAVGFATQFASMAPSHAAAASTFAGLINTWMKTGTATPSGGGSPIHWS